MLSNSAMKSSLLLLLFSQEPLASLDIFPDNLVPAAVVATLFMKAFLPLLACYYSSSSNSFGLLILLFIESLLVTLVLES